MKMSVEKQSLVEAKNSASGGGDSARWYAGGDAAARRPYLPSGAIRTFLADDSPFVVALLTRVLSKDSRIGIVGSATDGRCCFQRACMSRADLVLIDFHVAGADSVEIIRWLKQLRKPPVVVVIASEDSAVARARSLAAGADAFLLKTEELGVQLRRVVDSVFEGEESSDGSFAPAGL